jgi:hypothetical protein
VPEQIKGLVFDQIIFDYLKKQQEQESRGHLNLGDAEKETGLNGPAIIRAVAQIRAKGYPLISTQTRRLWENDFRLPQSQKEYMDWREKFVTEIKDLVSILRTCDEGALAQFGTLPIQEHLF